MPVCRARSNLLSQLHGFAIVHSDNAHVEDVDLLVILPFSGKSVNQSVQMRLQLRPDFPVDLIVRTPDKVRQRLEMGDCFMQEIFLEGKVLYEADH